MLKILLVQEDVSLNDKIAFVLETVNGVVVTTTKNLDEAKIIVAEKNRINLIIANLPSGRTKEVEEFQKLARSIDCLLTVNDPKDYEETIGWKVLDKIQRSLYATKLKEVVEKIVQDRYGYFEKLKFCRIKTSILLETSPLHCDIYAKLSDSKFIKIFLAGDTFDENDFQKYTETRKIEYMFLREDSCKSFIDKYISVIDKTSQNKNELTYEQLTNMNKVAFESVQELINVIGFNKDVQRLAKSHIHMMVQKMDKKPNLQKLLARVLTTKGKYQSDHSYLVSYIACGIATHLQWGSEATFYKLSLASFFHDIAIVDDKLAACTTLAEAKDLGLDDKALEGFKNHPATAADLVRRMSEIPADVDAIIHQHHELPDGKGFPRGTTANYISPLSTVFIIAHDMAKEVMKNRERGIGPPFDLISYLTNAQDKFTHSNFRRILVAAKKLDIPL